MKRRFSKWLAARRAAWLARRRSRGAYSLRRRLTGSILGASILVWAVSLAIVVHVAWRETSDVFDESLKEGARLALVLGSTLQSQGALASNDEITAREPAKLKLYYQIVGDDGRVLRRARNAPERAFSADLGRDSGFADVWVDGEAWRVYVLRADGQRFQVQIGQPWDERLELLEEVAEALVWPALVLLVLLGMFCWWVIRRLLAPIDVTAARIATKSPDDLTPVDGQDAPRELQPIVHSFNGVLGRLNNALQAERRFTADAAHELRTPLAALRMRIQLMQRKGDETPSLQSLRDDVDRCSALVESLLALARLDPERPDALVKEEVNLQALFKAVAGNVAADSGMTLQIDCRAPSVYAHPALLQSALRNVVDNAIRYGSAQGRVLIESDQALGRIRIAVRDDGPGVPEADQKRLGERFFRVLGTGRSGSGLGLSIVARVARLHDATLSFEPGLDGRGLGVVMEFPAR